VDAPTRPEVRLRARRPGEPGPRKELLRARHLLVTITDVSAYDAFAAIYDDWSAHMTEDVAWYVELAREADGPVVELAAGNGRVAVPVEAALGRTVIGIDSSPAMLESARARSEAAGVELDLRLGDMRELELEEPAALVYCPFRSLLHLPTWSDRRRLFERVAASLRPGGRFAWNAFVFSHRVAARVDGVHQVERGIGHTVHQFPHESRLDIVLDDGPTVSLWWATKAEWEGLIDVAGLEVEALYGGFAREPFGEGSTEFVWIARKPL
jgi:SAM-dependent methyltransferase